MFEVADLEKVQKELDDQRKALAKKAKDTGADALKLAFKGFFKAFPQVERIYWTQYTPHFNDGDPCEFRVHEPYFILANGPIKAAGKAEDYASGKYEPEEKREHDAWSLRYNLEQGKPGFTKELADAASQVSSKLQSMSDVLEAAFDDHAKVTVTPEEIKVEEYEHD